MFVSRKRMLEILEQAQEGDRTSLFVDRFLSFLIVTNILAVSLESVESIGIAYRQAFLIFEYFSVVIFGFEDLIFREIALDTHCPSKLQSYICNIKWCFELDWPGREIPEQCCGINNIRISK